MSRGDRLEEVTAEDLSGPRIDRRTATKILAAAGLGSLAGCLGNGDSGGDDGSGGDGSGDDGSTGDDGSDGGGSDRSGGRLTVAWKSNEIYNLDPQFTTASLLQPLIANIFSGLVRMTPELTFVGDVAEDWEVSDDETTITFSLRDDSRRVSRFRTIRRSS